MMRRGASRLLASIARLRVVAASSSSNGAGAPRGFVSVARELPPDDHVPEPYTGPSKEEVLAMRKEFLSPGERERVRNAPLPPQRQTPSNRPAL